MVRRAATVPVSSAGERSDRTYEELLPPLSIEESAQYELDMAADEHSVYEGHYFAEYGRFPESSGEQPTIRSAGRLALKAVREFIATIRR